MIIFELHLFVFVNNKGDSNEYEKENKTYYGFTQGDIVRCPNVERYQYPQKSPSLKKGCCPEVAEIFYLLRHIASSYD